MPFQMKIQPIDSLSLEESPTRFEPVKPVVKSRLKRFFDLQFLKPSSASDKASVSGGGPVDEPHFHKENANGSAVVATASEFEPSSVCLAKMVQNFIEENNEKQPGSGKCSRNRCNCFNGNCTDSSSEDEFDSFGDSNIVSSAEAIDILKSLVPCESVSERNLLADTARIVDKNKINKRKDDFCRKIVFEGLINLGYNASICKCRWEKSPSHPAGEYEYIDVIISTERIIIDIDFRSEFEIARSTKTYNSLLQTLPFIFVGKSDRLQRIISIVTDAAKQSLKRKGMHIPPWRTAEYVKAKWLSPHTRETNPSTPEEELEENSKSPVKDNELGPLVTSRDEIEEDSVDDNELGESVFAMSSEGSVGDRDEESSTVPVTNEWIPPEIKPKSFQIGVAKTGLASVIED